MVDDIQTQGRDVHWDCALEQISEEVRIEAAERGFDHGSRDYEDWVEDEMDRRREALSNSFYDDEPVHEFEIDGVKGQTAWLGGALLVWVFESPHLTKAWLCSACVPNCGDLDSLDEDGEECYDVPPEWRWKED